MEYFPGYICFDINLRGGNDGDNYSGNRFRNYHKEIFGFECQSMHPTFRNL